MTIPDETCECLASDDCDDGDACTTDECVNFECANSSSVCECRSPADCEDGHVCTTHDCVGSRCVTFADECECQSPVVCEDGIPCTTHDCVGFRCVTDNSQCGCDTPADCEDGHACATHDCVDSFCTTEADACECETPVDCEDGIACTLHDCIDFACVTVDDACECQTPDDCDDGDVCTVHDCIDLICVTTQLPPGCDFVLDPESLRAKTDPDLQYFGAAVDTSALTFDPLYAEVLGREFNTVTPENAMKWEIIHPQPNLYDYTEADTLVDFAGHQLQTVHGHVLVGSGQLPAWLESLTGTELENAMFDHVQTIVTHYAGRVERWDVVSELLADGGPAYRDTHLWRELGPGYVETVFEAAHQADPTAELIYSDFGILAGGLKADATYDIVSDLVQRGVPIHGVALQAHIGPQFPVSAYTIRYGLVPEAPIRANIQRFGALGLNVYLSEVDIQTKDLAMNDADKAATQREAYRFLVDLCKTEPSCRGVSTWGVSDKYSWIDATFGPDDPLLFDEAFAKKEAYFGAADGMEGIQPLPFFFDSSCQAPGISATLCDPFEGNGLSGWFVESNTGQGSADTVNESYRGQGALESTTIAAGGDGFALREVFAEKTDGPVHIRAYVFVPSTIDVQAMAIFGSGEASPPYQGITLNLFDGGKVQLSATTALQFPDSGLYTVPRDQWFCANLDWTIHATSGTVSASIDGIERVSIAGIDTLPEGGFSNALAGMTWTDTAQPSAQVRIDDFAISTTPLPCD